MVTDARPSRPSRREVIFRHVPWTFRWNSTLSVLAYLPRGDAARRVNVEPVVTLDAETDAVTLLVLLAAAALVTCTSGIMMISAASTAVHVRRVTTLLGRLLS